MRDRARRLTARACCLAAAVLLTTLVGCGSQRTPSALPQPTVPVVHATARQVARAMEEDRFFATYNNTILLIRGPILSLSRHDRNTVLEVGTGLATKVLCDLGSHSTVLHAGDAVTIESADPQEDASRVPAGVMLSNCVLYKG